MELFKGKGVLQKGEFYVENGRFRFGDFRVFSLEISWGNCFLCWFPLRNLFLYFDFSKSTVLPIELINGFPRNNTRTMYEIVC